MSTVVGICAAIERASWGPFTGEAMLTPRSYVNSLQRSGGTALLLAPDDVVAEDPDLLLDRIDALILAGGADIDPASYGARPDPATETTWPERDRFELALAHRAMQRDIPLLGICRGMQLLNVACGGTLIQHLPDRLGSERHSHQPGVFGDHGVRLREGSLAERAAGSPEVTVKSHHHQGVDELGEELEVTGWSLEDDVIEAIELAGRRFALGVQWHPEEDVKDRVIAALVAATTLKASPAMPQIVRGGPAA